jgi:hypothetical protein
VAKRVLRANQFLFAGSAASKGEPAAGRPSTFAALATGSPSTVAVIVPSSSPPRKGARCGCSETLRSTRCPASRGTTATTSVAATAGTAPGIPHLTFAEPTCSPLPAIQT